MYRRFQNRFGTAGVIVAVVALIAALSGTALAASGALTGKQKKEVEKIAKKYAGKPGAAGAAGANGTNGTNGKDGSNGTIGKDGAAGKSVVLVNSAPPNCPEGGFTYEVQGSGQKNEVCKGLEGPEGPEGPEGDPAEYPDHLLPGKTEVGAWSFAAPPGKAEDLITITFPIPLAVGLDGLSHVHFDVVGTEDVCKGEFQDPTAPPGNFCIYMKELVNATPGEIGDISFGTNGTSTFGSLVSFGVTDDEEPSYGVGAWALSE